MNSKAKLHLTLAVIIIEILIPFFLQGLYLMLAWQWIIVPIFKVSQLSYWGATGLNLMYALMFKNHSKFDGSCATDLNKELKELVNVTIVMAIEAVLVGVLWLVSLGI
ncbi:hypothetical protein NE303_10895 [Levilactobacillus brevis]|uniref:hypothetical protein n=1 Tax=Levilactobacillus brevis TaxID=1580 RepID=UPI00207351EC|nr:hypothetical protein [Levilactobacillus brevis]MCM6799446.1 hypothetical protein [Levilactobacillus brevis]MCM6801855.1 hypothetical protein [Levilactobacillus brevis]MCM6806549.1 hypothetical protein [Levilactobacillus brevis]MCM6807488.1 hypothetical protein [Levilactobacillus brevis]MCM6813372.1 hypothetical protein [Levilactobacillus brevis]